MTARTLIESALPSKNTSWGFMGTLMNSYNLRPRDADALWDYIADQIGRLGSATPEDARDFLDAAQGRHLANELSMYVEGDTLDAFKVAVDQVLELPWVLRTLRKFCARDGIAR